MKRRLFNLAAAVSLALCVATVALWVRGYHTQDEIKHFSLVDTGREPTPIHCRDVAVWSASGGVVVVVTRRELGRGDATKPDPGWRYSRQQPRPYPRIGANPFTLFDRGGLQVFNRRQRLVFADPQLMLRVPCWLFVSMLLPLPLIASTRALRRQSRQRQQRCPACGYDLRATPDRCPECGTIAREAPRTAA